MTDIKVVFFGSTSESVLVASKIQNLIPCVVTQPPRPIGRHKEITATPVETWAKKHHIPVLSFSSSSSHPFLFADEQTVIDAIQPFKPELLVSASYGQKIPTQTITDAKFGGLNVHPSLLPRWRGADPVPWAILSGDTQTGVTIVTLAEKFDEGKIIAQKKIPILPTDTTQQLYPKLFTLGAELLIQTLPDYLSGKNKGKSQGSSPTPYARRLTKQDGFVSWEVLADAMKGRQALEVDRKFRAFDPWPGLWTQMSIKRETKRLKILKLHLREAKLVIDEVQLEGKNPIAFQQFQRAYSFH